MFVLRLGMLVVSACALSLPAHAQQGLPGAPAYLHVISDLRLARAYIQADPRPQNGNEKAFEIAELTKAIQEIKAAAIDDGKDPSFSPPPDTQGLASGPLHEAIRLIKRARADCNGAIDTPNAAGMKFRALHHIDQAQGTLIGFLREVHEI
jgi:hypothetical protein